MICVADSQAYTALCSYLIAEKGFAQGPVFQRLVFKASNSEIDIIPYHEKYSQITLKNSEDGTISTTGIDKLSQYTVALYLDDLKVAIADLSSIIILKLIAWSERPERRTKDIPDIANIMRIFYDFHEDEIWEKHNDLYDDKKTHEIGYQVAGRKIGYMLQNAPNLLQQVIAILQKELTKQEQSSFLQKLIIDPEKETIAEKIDMINLVLKGMKNK